MKPVCRQSCDMAKKRKDQEKLNVLVKVFDVYTRDLKISLYF